MTPVGFDCFIYTAKYICPSVGVILRYILKLPTMMEAKNYLPTLNSSQCPFALSVLVNGSWN